MSARRTILPRRKPSCGICDPISALRRATMASMTADPLTLSTMPPGTPFLERLAQALVADSSLGGRFPGAQVLADFTILLPTRRAVRALGDAFLRAGDGAAMLLPSIRALGDVDEEELVL